MSPPPHPQPPFPPPPTPPPTQSCQNFHSCTQHVISLCSTFLPSIIKIFRRALCYRAETRNQIQTKDGEITPKVKKAEVVILVCDMSSGPVLHYYQVSSKYSQECWTHQNIPKGIHVTEQTRSFMPTPMPTLTPTPMGSVPKTICPPQPLVRGYINIWREIMPCQK